MQRLNPIDAIAPAFTRTHELLFKPFRIGRSWKLAAVSYCAFWGSFFVPLPLFWVFALRRGAAPLLPLVAVVGVVATLVCAAVFYCFVRLELVDFEMVVTTSKIIAPMWRRYSGKVWPWFGLKVALGLIATSLIGLVLLTTGKAMLDGFTSFAGMGPHPDPAVSARMLVALLKFETVFLLLMLIPKTLATLLDDFVLPFFLIDNLPLLTAMQRGFAVLAGDPVQCILYLILKLILSVIGYVMQAIALQICMIPVVLVGVAIVIAGAAIFRHAGPAATLIAVAGGVLLGLIFVVVISYLSILAFGYLLLLLDSYAIYFLAGRYPQLGNLLEPGSGTPFTPPPVLPSPEETQDDDDGPPMPMNPAIA